MIQMFLLMIFAAAAPASGGGDGGGDDGIEALIERALRGDRGALRRLTQWLWPVIHATVRYWLRRSGRERIGPHDSDDLSQEVWAHLFAKDGYLLRRFDPSRGNLEAYVTMIAKSKVRAEWHKAAALRRGGDKRMADIDDMHGVSGGSTPEGEAMGRELARRLREALLERLPERGRLIFTYVYVDGKKPAEVAERMRVKTQVVYNWQHRIRAIIREIQEPSPAT